MDKSLAPLIAVFALIVLLSMILLNSNFMNQKGRPVAGSESNHCMAIREEEYPQTLSPVDSRQQSSDNAELIDVGDMLGKAKKYIAAGKTGDAEDLLRTILLFYPDHRQALSLMGGILYYSNRYKEAEVIFRRQIKLDPNNSLAYNRLGSALAKQKRYKEAIDSASISLGMHPDSGDAHINLAGMYSVVGDKQKAIEHFRKAFKLIGYAILPLSFDEAFDNIRQMPEFQSVILEAKQMLPIGFNGEKFESKTPGSGVGSRGASQDSARKQPETTKDSAR